MSEQQGAPAGEAVAPRPLMDRVRTHWRALALVAATLGAFGLLALLSYQMALARVPQHRAALERFVQAQTGFEVRFATLEVGLGWHGPEALFTHIEMREPGRRAAIVRAPRLTVAFDTWRILRNGQVQAARITLVDPEIDLAPLLASTPRSAAAATAPGTRLRLLERLPLLRIDVEGGTLRVPPEAPEGLPYALRISRAALRRSAEATSANALVLLPPHLGRSLFLALRLEGPLGALSRTSGSLRVNGRSLAFPSWREILPFRWTPAAGSGEVTATLEWRRGELEQLEGEFEARGVAWRPRAAQSLYRFPRLRGAVTARRHGKAVRWYITGLELDDGHGGGSGARLELETGPEGRFAGESAALPLGAILGLARAAGLAPAPELQALRAAGEMTDLRFDWQAAAAPGERLHAEARLHGLGISAAGQPASLAGLEAQLRATDEHVELRASAPGAQLHLPALFARLPEPLALEATLRWSREGAGWKLVGEGLRLEHPAFAMTMHGDIGSGGEGPPAFELRATLERLDPAALQGSFALDPRWTTPAAVAAALRSGELGSGELVLLGSLDPASLTPTVGDFAGRFVARQVSVAAGESWPEGEALGGEMVWGGGRVHLELHEGRIAGLELEHAVADWQTDSARPLSLTLASHGPIEQARAWLATRSSLREELGGLAGLELSGPTRFELALGRERRGSGAGLSWRLEAAIEGGRLALGPSLPSVERLTGTLALDGPRLQSAHLAGVWLDGPMSVRHLVHRARNPTDGGWDYGLAAEGRAGPAALLGALGLEAGAAGYRALPEALAWTAELRHGPSTARDTAGWRADFHTSLGEPDSESMPPAFAWARDPRLPLTARLELPERGAGTLRLEAFGALQVLAALARREDRWAVERAALRFGTGEPPVLPSEPRLAIAGEVERLDPWATLAASRLLEAAGAGLPGSIDLGTRVLLLGSHELPATRLSGGFDERELRLVLAGRDLAGSIDWPRQGQAARPAELRFARFILPEGRNAAGAALAVLAAAPNAELAIDEFGWGERRLGRLQARASARDGDLELQDIRLAGPALEAHGEGGCHIEPRRCRWTLQLESSNVAAALRSAGFAPDLQAGEAEGELELVWAPTPEHGGWAALSGRIRARLENGTAQPAASDPLVTPLPLIAGPAALLRASVPGVGFESFAGVFELGDGELHTRERQIVTPAGELAVSGRADLAARLYDQQAVLSTDSGLSAALRRLREERSLSAAVGAMRDLVGSGEPQRSVYALRGGWDAPIVEPIGEARR